MTRLKVTVEKQADINLLVDFFKEKGIDYQIYNDDQEAFEIKNVLKEDEVAYQKADIKFISYDKSNETLLVPDDQDFILTDEIKQVLNERYQDHIAGHVKMISAEESERQIEQLLSKRR